MGRPRLYHSAEEKAVANRKTSQQHYEKNKRSINKKRRKDYARQCQAERKQEIIPAVDETQPTTVEINPLATWMEAVERVHRSLNRVIEGAPREYVEQICSAFLEHQDKDRIHTKIVKLSKFQNSIYRYSNEVYALAGVAPEFERASEVSREVNMVLSWAEEILCYAMIGVKEVRDRYVGKEFMYQAK
ncbi:hypothetical protein BJ912DRAFT_937122 [Pholiota molesta]|nr:hypothetical protein BJ912DRAFT_937122 [Pholiota molesta]